MQATWIKANLARFFAAAGMALAMAYGMGFAGIEARETDPDNYFVLHPGPVGGRTDIDPNDPYAPVDLSAASDATSGLGNLRVAGQSALSSGTASEWSSNPRLPGRPF